MPQGAKTGVKLQGRRKPSVDDPKVQAIINALQGGNYIETACAYAGLAPSTVYRWLERGRDERERQESGAKSNPAEQPYLEICNAVEKARAQSIVANVTIIQQAARSGQWQAAAWWLERTMPQQFGRKTQTEVTGQVSVNDLERRMLELLGEDSEDIQEDDS